MLECHQIQDDLRNGRRLQQQGSPQAVCSEIVPRRYSRQPAGPRHFVNSPLPIESFKYPGSGQKYALEFDITYAGVTGIAFNLSTLIQHRWNPYVDWSKRIAQTDLLTMYQKRDTLNSTFPLLTGQRPPQLAPPQSKSQGAPPAQMSGKPSSSTCAASAGYEASSHVDKSRKVLEQDQKEASFENHMEHLEDGHWSPPDGYQSSTSTQLAGDPTRDANIDKDLLEDVDLAELWRTDTEDLY